MSSLSERDRSTFVISALQELGICNLDEEAVADAIELEFKRDRMAQGAWQAQVDALRRELDSFKGAVDLEFVAALNQIQEERDHYTEYSDRFSKQTIEHVNDALNDIEHTVRQSREKLGTQAVVQTQAAEFRKRLSAMHASTDVQNVLKEAENWHQWRRDECGLPPKQDS